MHHGAVPSVTHDPHHISKEDQAEISLVFFCVKNFSSVRISSVRIASYAEPLLVKASFQCLYQMREFCSSNRGRC